MFSRLGQDTPGRPVVLSPEMGLNSRDCHTIRLGNVDKFILAQVNPYVTGICGRTKEDKVSRPKLMPLNGDALFHLFSGRTGKINTEKIPVNGLNEAGTIDIRWACSSHSVVSPFPLGTFISDALFCPVEITTTSGRPRGLSGNRTRRFQIGLGCAGYGTQEEGRQNRQLAKSQPCPAPGLLE
jgi:hypothetical protein